MAVPTATPTPIATFVLADSPALCVDLVIDFAPVEVEVEAAIPVFAVCVTRVSFRFRMQDVVHAMGRGGGGRLVAMVHKLEVQLEYG
jgi:hypothetical protein